MLTIDIRNWMRNIEQHASEGVNKILIGNKADMLDKKIISKDQGQALADEYGIKFIECSAKSNIGIYYVLIRIGVEEAFFTLARDIKKRLIDTAQDKESNNGTITVDDKKGSSITSSCCGK